MDVKDSQKGLKTFLHSNVMHIVIFTLVMANGIVLGLRTESELTAHYGSLLLLIDRVIIGVLVLELLLRFLSSGSQFFLRGWNIFDAIILSISIVAIMKDIAVLEALRIMLLFRVVELIPAMKHVVEAIKRAVLGLTNAVILLLVVFYTFAVASTHLFGSIAAEQFGNVGRAMFTLFQLMAFDNLGDIIRPLMAVKPYAWAFFVVFLVLTSFSILNLFIGIIVQAMQDASKALSSRKSNISNQEDTS